jgi:hypothetical protein
MVPIRCGSSMTPFTRLPALDKNPLVQRAGDVMQRRDAPQTGSSPGYAAATSSFSV